MLNASLVWLLSAMMAFPIALWAKSSDELSRGATEGVPVILQPIHLANGSEGYIAIAPVPQTQENSLVKSLGTDSPNSTILAVAGPDDPALQAALESGNATWINSFIVADGPNSELLSTVKPSMREKLTGKLKAIRDFCVREKQGLMTAVWVSGWSTGFIMYETSSVSAGMKALVALFGWAAFQGAFSKNWDGYLDHGAELFKKVGKAISRLFGRDVTKAEIHAFEVAGKFHASWLANTAVDAYVFWNAGTLTGLMQALWYGFLSSNDILDPSVSKKMKQGKISELVFKKFILVRILAGSVFEVAGFLNVPYAQVTLLTVTIGGLSYLAFGHIVEQKAVPSVRRCSDLLVRKTKRKQVANAA